MTQLRLSPRLRLPVDAVTETFAILAKRGAGKTYTASVLVEEMLQAKLQVVVVDPIGAWWGLRAGADGKRDGGYPIAILGGDRGDVPLEPTGGKVVADLVVDERLSALLDLVRFSKGERRRFVADFLERLYQRNRDPMHVVLEEADLFAPEGRLKRAGDEAMLGAVYDLVRRGRARGLGSTLITQRSASISKEVLTQAEILIALRTTGPHDRAAIEEWIKFHGSKEERDVVLGELSHLPTGTAFVWWPVEEILRKVEIRERRTFDSSATPRPGQRKRPPKTLADVDLGALTVAMAATIEKAKAEDPRELRRQLAQARKELASRPKEVEQVEVSVEVPVIREQDLEQLERILAPAVNGMAAVLEDAQVLLREIRDRAGKAPALPGRTRAQPGDPRSVTSPRGAEAVKERPRRPPRPGSAGTAPTATDEDIPSLKAGARRMVDALASLHPSALTRTQIATLADVAPKSGTFSDYLSTLRRTGLIADEGGRIVLTEAGQEYGAHALGAGAPQPEQLQEMWGRKLKAGARRMLDVLMAEFPGGVSRAELAERADIASGSGTFSDYLSSLRRNALAEDRGGLVYAGEALFLSVSA